jgi:recombinational DNA repair protein (RecF pathway)
MRHRYDTHSIVLARTGLGEVSVLVTLLTPELGLLRARAQGVRSSGAKLASALTTFSESAVILVRGKEGWRLAGAVAEVDWFTRLSDPGVRERAARVGTLLLRLVAGEGGDPALFRIMKSYFEALSHLPLELHEAAEVLAVLRLLEVLGLDTGETLGSPDEFSPELLREVSKDRAGYIARINAGIAASGL